MAHKEPQSAETTGISDDGEMFYAKTMDGEMIAVPVDADTPHGGMDGRCRLGIRPQPMPDLNA